MHRRRFLETGLLGGLGFAVIPGPLSLKASGGPTRHPSAPVHPSHTLRPVPGLDLQELAAEHRRMLFDEYLPFWENGGYDHELGGFMCYLHDDGTVQDERKDIWYQGRGIWVYSFLYNNIDPNPKWLAMAEKSRDFMVEHMHRGDGTWIDTVNRVGEPADVVDIMRTGNIYGALFAAVGLIQLAKAGGSGADLDLAKKTIRKASEQYEDSSYRGVTVAETSEVGLRAQGHSFMFVWVVGQLLEVDPDPDPWFESVLRQHLDRIEHRFWNPEYGISNETLFHDYRRIPGLADQMVPGHSIETQWMSSAAAIQLGDQARAASFRDRMRRLIEMNWDYVFGGLGDTDFHVFATEAPAAGPEFGIKAMWAQAEVLVGSLRAYAETGEPWALEWYERMWVYVRQTMTTDYGVWRQAVDRRGEGLDRPGISPYRKGNFHQPRCLMLNLLQIEGMIERDRTR